MIRFIPTEYQTVLEVGGLNGAFSDNLSIECEYWCVDPAIDEGIKVSQLKHKIISMEVEDAIAVMPKKYFDLIVLNDVLEHLVDPNSVLLQLKGLLKDSGVLIGSVPNVRFIGVLWDLLIRKDWRYREQGVLDATHLRFFTRKSLIRMLRDSGYCLDNISGINSELSRARILRRIFLSIVILVSFGQLADSRYPQWGFRARHA